MHTTLNRLNVMFVSVSTYYANLKKDNKKKTGTTTDTISPHIGSKCWYVKWKRLFSCIYVYHPNVHTIKTIPKWHFFENNSKSFSKIFQNPTKKCCFRKIYRKDFGQHTKKYNLCYFIHVISTNRRRYYGNALCHEVTQEMFHKIIQYGLPTLWAADTWPMVWVCCCLFTIIHWYSCPYF